MTPSSLLRLLFFVLVLGVPGSAQQQPPAQDDKILERGDLLLEESKSVYEEARSKNSVAAFVEAGFKLEEARIKFIVLQEIGSPEKQKIATDRLRAVNQLSKLIHDGKVASSGAPEAASAERSPDSPATSPSKDPGSVSPPAPVKPAVDVSKRAPVPDAAKQKEAERLVKDLFKDLYAKKTPADKQALAAALLDLARKSKDDPASVWVSCREAQDLATQSCDLKTLIGAIEEAAKEFDIDALAMKNSALLAAGKAAKSPEDFVSLATALEKLIDELMAADLYDAADKAATAAAQHARRANDPKLLARTTSRSKDVAEAKSRYQSMKNTLQTLARNPEEPAANLEMGQFLCFVKANWDLGLRFLAKGSDPAMKALSEKELGLLANPGDRAAVADGWYDLAEKEKVPYRKTQLFTHVRGLYEIAVEDAVGVARVRIEKRLEVIQAAIGTAPGERPSINLIKLIDPAQDSVVGDWIVSGGSLQSTKQTAWAHVQIPYLPPDEYDLNVVVERKDSGVICIGLAKGNVLFFVALDGGHGTGLELLDGKAPEQNETLYSKPVLGIGKPATLVCSVRKEGVSVTADGKKIVDWKGNFSRLGHYQEFSVPNPRALCMGAYNTVCIFSKIELTAISGQGKKAR